MKDPLPNALRIAAKKRLEEAPPPPLPLFAEALIDYPRLIAAAWQRVKVRQGTLGCVAFAKGAEWMQEQMAATALQYVGEVVIGEEGMTKGWTVIRWRADLPLVPVGTKLYAELASPESKEG